jgi:hypothetical protein
MAAFGADVSSGMAVDMQEEEPAPTTVPKTISSPSPVLMEISEDTTVTASPCCSETDQFAEEPTGDALPKSVKTFLGNRQFNTTSTVMASNTIVNPDLPQIFFT